jgi:hypothetical protein
MMHAICAMLVLALALAEIEVMSHWAHQHAASPTQQAASHSVFRSSDRISN